MRGDRLPQSRPSAGTPSPAIRQFGGREGIRDLGLVDSAVCQPQTAFGGQDLYPTLIEKASALGFSLISNHGFIDGNKRVGYAAIDVFLRLNNHKVSTKIDDAEAAILNVAAGIWTREQFTAWLQVNTVKA